MTRKHFIAIAAILKERMEIAKDMDKDVWAVTRTAEELANYFEEENANFDKALFLAACGVE